MHQSPVSPPPTAVLLPIALAASAAIGFAFTDALSKFLTESVPPLEVSWGRAVFSGLLAAAMLGRHGWADLRGTPRLGLGLLRGVISAVVPALSVLSVSLLPLALCTAIFFLSPVLMTILSVPMLGEKVGARRWAAVVIGFVAVLIIVQPASEGFGWIVAVPVAVAVLGAFYPLLTRFTAPGASPAVLMALGPGLGAVLMSLVVPFFWVTPSWTDAGLLLICGVTHAFCHLLVIRAFSAAPTSVLAPFQYVQMPFAIVAGYFAFQEVPRLTTIAGAVLLIGAGIYIAYREHQLSRRSR